MLIGTYILIVILTTNTAGTLRPVAFTQEFNLIERCEAAKESIRNKAEKVQIHLLTCEKK